MTRAPWLSACLAALSALPAWAVAPAACDGPFRTLLAAASPLPAAAIEARAAWLDERRIRWAGVSTEGRFALTFSRRGAVSLAPGEPVRGADRIVRLRPIAAPAASPEQRRFSHIAAGPTLELRGAGDQALRALHRGQLLLVRTDAAGRVLDATRVQLAGAIDALYARAEALNDLGATVRRRATSFKLWAPTARSVALCLYRSAQTKADRALPMRRDPRTGVWHAALRGDLSGRGYAYLVDVWVAGQGWVRNLATDPYSLGLAADSKRSVVVDLDSPRLKPPQWDATPRPDRVRAMTDLVIYELHVRDFSAADPTVSASSRGKYLAFTESRSKGIEHLAALSAAGITDLHLLPVFDFATVPERGCVEPAIPAAATDSESQQAAVSAAKARDCFNWGYDPLHFTAPEGSYASDAADAATRIVEFRAMVQSLHRLRLRVGMDMVYNHTSASGQHPHSVLDRIVPGYYHRLDAKGAVERSTCCDNTATEHRMMAKLMIDSAVVWARDYRIDSMRFDLMGHQPRAAMHSLQRAVNAAAGRHVHLIGEGWNFGEVADGARFVQASQLSLGGSGIATFNDRLRDAARGGGAQDRGEAQIVRQGWASGLVTDANSLAAGTAGPADLSAAADLVRAGLAGSIRDYALPAPGGGTLPLERLAYGAQPAGYASEPGEVVNYTENHDNQTLFDSFAFKLPTATPREERARAQHLANALVALAQGVAYFHAGQDILRSKSMDRNSYDSGDWFNRIDWSLETNHFGSGLPPAQDNAESWPLMKPLLADPAIAPTAAEIRWTRDAFVDLLRIRASTTLLRLRSAKDIRERLRFHHTGAADSPALIIGHVDGAGVPGAVFRELVYLINADRRPQAATVSALQHKPLVLHPVHRAAGAADRRAAAARFDALTGRFDVPPRTAVVFVAE
jgi:pullulanase/glycogen debranching enzyme